MPYMKPVEMLERVEADIVLARRLCYKMKQLAFHELFALWPDGEKSMFINSLQNGHFAHCLELLDRKKEGWDALSVVQLRRMARKCKIKNYTVLNKTQLIVLLKIKEAEREKAFTPGIPTNNTNTDSKTN